MMHIKDEIILHIANGYADSAIYKNLVQELDKLDLQQIVYTPQRTTGKIGANKIDFQHYGSELIYSSILNWHIDRVFYPFKIFKILKDIQTKVDFNHITCMHAHTWYSDGGVAYFLSKKYNIPFVVSIRSTDLNLFQKKLVYLQPFGRSILNSARKVILISASYKEKLLNQSSLKKMKIPLRDKISVIPNGVDFFWIKNTSVKPKEKVVEVYNILYLGSFISRKKVLDLQQAVIELNGEQSKKIMLHLVGGGGKDEAEVLKLVEKHAELFVYHGRVYDKAAMQCIFKNCDVFAMPSRNETFGLVYIEALLQGLPILYTEGEGVDGYYKERIGERIGTHSVKEIKEKLRTMVDNLGQYSIPLEKIKRNHDWALIAREYRSIYKG